jgi:polyhydroxyalkanoate synthesis regulator protein
MVACLRLMEGKMTEVQKSESIIIKRQAKSRLFVSESQRYISIEQLRGWAAEGLAFIVFDSETGADITDVIIA